METIIVLTNNENGYSHGFEFERDGRSGDNISFDEGVRYIALWHFQIIK